MSFMGLRRLLIWGSTAAIFATVWAWTIACFGLRGLYLGWIPAAAFAWVAAALVSILWSFIALTVLLAWHFHASERGGAFGAEASA